MKAELFAVFSALRSTLPSILVALAATQPASAQADRNASQAGRRYSVEASVQSELRAAATKTPRRATIAIVVRISSHSRETNFSGDVRAAFPDFDLDKGSPSQKIWEEPVCHQNRGLPKITILSFDGVLEADGGPEPVASRIRQLGLHLPNDELVLVQRVETSISVDGEVRTLRARSRSSGIAVTIKLLVQKCPLV